MPSDPDAPRRRSLLFAVPGRGEDLLVCALRDGLAAAEIRLDVVSLDPSGAEADLVARIVDQARGAAWALGGFSLGARLALRAAARVCPSALLLLGHPFHRRGDPASRPGLDALRGVDVPTLVVQGTRDAHGSRSEVRGYEPLPSPVRVHWLEDGNHRFVPRARSGLQHADHLAATADAAAAFLLGVACARD